MPVLQPQPKLTPRLITQVMGYSIAIMQAEPSTEKLPTFDAIAFNLEDVLSGDKRPIIPLPEKPTTNHHFLKPGTEPKPTYEKRQRDAVLQDMLYTADYMFACSLADLKHFPFSLAASSIASRCVCSQPHYFGEGWLRDHIAWHDDAPPKA